jgi:hypothetical protein
MKWFLGVCGFVCAVGIGIASCGPQRDFCPTKTDDFICFFEDGGGMGGAAGQDLGPCDGAAFIICSGQPYCGNACP